MEKDPKTIQANSVDEYLKELPQPMRVVLEALRQVIKSAAPEAEELISYRIPTYKFKGPLVHFAAFKNHCSLITVNKSIVTDFEAELKLFKITGTTIQFTPEKPLPADLVTKIVMARIKENELNAAGKTGRSKKSN